jgi:hypothetical protein
VLRKVVYLWLEVSLLSSVLDKSSDKKLVVSVVGSAWRNTNSTSALSRQYLHHIENSKRIKHEEKKFRIAVKKYFWVGTFVFFLFAKG